MNALAFNNLSIDRIGYSCFEEAVSCALNYMDSLYLALNYNFHYFIFNKSTFTNYKLEQEPEKYLFENNMLLFKSKPHLQYRDDFGLILETMSSDFFNKNLVEVNTSDLSVVKSKYLDRNRCVCLLVDPFYLKEDYIKHCKRFRRDGRHLTHFINLFDIDFHKGTCKIADVNYSIKCDVSLERLVYAHSKVSPFAFYLRELDLSEVEIKKLIKRNLSCLSEEHITIKGTKYLVNSQALKQFTKDFQEIIYTVNSFAGKYSSQYISLPLSFFRNMTKGNFVLYKHMKEKYSFLFLDKLVKLFEKYSDLWNTFDLKLDKIYLKGESILAREKEFIDIIKKLLAISEEIIDEIFIVNSILEM